MRWNEILAEDDSDSADIESQILTALEFLRNRDHNKKLLPKHSTIGVINMINNISPDVHITYETLEQLKNSNQAIGQLITNLDRESITLQAFGDEPGAPEEPQDQEGEGGNAKDPTKVVDAMAKRASANRS